MTEPRQLFRYPGLLACVMVRLPAIVDHCFATSAKLRSSTPLTEPQVQAVPVALCALELALSLGFVIAFWWNTRSIGNRKPGKAWNPAISKEWAVQRLRDYWTLTVLPPLLSLQRKSMQ
jgi:hypothetical protein